MALINIDALWNLMLSMCDNGHIFHTKRGLPFTLVKKDYCSVYVIRDGNKVRFITKKNMEFIIENPHAPRQKYCDEMQCSSYALAVYEELKNK